MRENKQKQQMNWQKNWIKKIFRGLCLLLIAICIGFWGKVQKVSAQEQAVVAINKSTSKSFDSIEKAWNYAIMRSVDDRRGVTVTLRSDWIADSASGVMGRNLTREEMESESSNTGDIEAFRKNGSIWVPKKAGVILDLNGHKIDRALKDPVENGEVFYLDGTLQIVNSAWDSSKKNGGIYGGANTSDGGAVIIASDGHLAMHQGVISNCKSEKNGGGIYVDGGTLELYEVMVENCTSAGYGGGIYLKNIRYRARINECTVQGCHANNDGAGIFVTGEQELTLKGRTIVRDNTLTDSRKNSNIILSDGAWVLDAGIAYDSDFDIGLINYKSNQSYLKNASQAKMLRGVYKVNESYHSKDSSSFTAQNTIDVGSYSASVFGQNPALFYGLAGITLAGLFVVVVYCRRKRGEKS